MITAAFFTGMCWTFLFAWSVNEDTEPTVSDETEVV